MKFTKFTKLTLGFLSFTSVLAVVPFGVTSAMAQCLQADVSVQYNISGSQQPTKRSNDVVMESEGRCTGNASVTRGVQGNVGGNGQVEQYRQVRHRQTGGGNNATGIDGSTVQMRSNVGIDVYNPADNFHP
jgi:hypothetical protein